MSHEHWFEVLDAGLSTTVQDAGRPGYAHLGVPPSGALDRDSYRLGNRLVGNLAGEAALETTLHGPRLALRGAGRGAVVAVTGAPAAVTVDGRPAALNAAITLLPGEVLAVGAVTSAVRSYIAVGGGIDVEPVMGSRSADTLSGLGPAPLSPGATLPIGHRGRPVPPVDVVGPRGIPRSGPVLDLVPGPRADWFGADAFESLTATTWAVSPASNRIGLRLTGPALRRLRDAELPPEGIVTGSVQVPPDGQPVIFLNDHPTTGGYPVIAVLTDDAVSLAAQAAPGTRVRFRVRHHRSPRR